MITVTQSPAPFLEKYAPQAMGKFTELLPGLINSSNELDAQLVAALASVKADTTMADDVKTAQVNKLNVLIETNKLRAAQYADLARVVSNQLSIAAGLRAGASAVMSNGFDASADDLKNFQLGIVTKVQSLVKSLIFGV